MVAVVQTSSPLLVKRGDGQFPTDDKCKRPRQLRNQEGKVVRFDEHPQTFEIPGRHVLLPQELSMMHTSKAEHTRIQMEIVNIIREYRRCMNGEPWRGKELDRLRGLERITNHDDRERPSRMKGVTSAVLRRQRNGEIDERWLSNVYRPLLEKAKSVALKRAMLDREAAFSDAPRIIVMSR